MRKVEIAIGVEVPEWTYNECDGCGCTYPVTRTSVKTIVESDLLCVPCWGVHVSAIKSDEIEDLTEQLATAKAEIAGLKEAIECLIIQHGIHDSYDGGLLPDNEQSNTIQAAINLLAKHKGE